MLVLILLSNVALKGNFGEAESKLLQGDDIDNVVPETVPEEVPEQLPATDNNNPSDSILFRHPWD